MKLAIERADLHAALGRVAKIVEARSTIPILSFLRLSAQDGALTITGTDLDIEATTIAPADVGAAGEATVAAREFASIVAKLAAGAQVALEAADGKIVVKAARARFTLATLPVEDYPSVPPLNAACAFALDAQAFAAHLGQVAFAISTEETCYYLNGVYLHQHVGEDGPMLRLVATDGHRLARLEIVAPDGSSALPGVIIPRKAVDEVRRLGKDAEGAVEIAVSAERVSFAFTHKGARTTLISKTIEGTFPDYARVIPQVSERLAVAKREALAGALERVRTIGDKGKRGMRFIFADGRITLTMSNPDLGEAVEEVDVDYDTSPLEIGFNAAYLAEIIDTLSAPQVEVRLNSPGDPVIIQDRGETALLIVLMPMRV